MKSKGRRVLGIVVSRCGHEVGVLHFSEGSAVVASGVESDCAEGDFVDFRLDGVTAKLAINLVQPAERLNTAKRLLDAQGDYWRAQMVAS
jgi:hypothetical protein